MATTCEQKRRARLLARWLNPQNESARFPRTFLKPGYASTAMPGELASSDLALLTIT